MKKSEKVLKKKPLVKKPRKKRKKVKARRYTDAEKRACALEYHLTGSIYAVARNTGFPEPTIRRWKLNEEWWGECMIQFREEYDDRIEAEFGEIMRLAHNNVQKQLVEGDEKLVYNSNTKEYEKHLVKPSAKDSAVIAAVAFDKRRLTLNKPTSITGTTQGAIEDLAKQFRDLSRTYNEKKVNSIKGELVED